MKKKTKTKLVEKKNKVGRPLFDGKSEEIVVKKLEGAYAIGATDEEACFSAGISTRALYEYQKKNKKFLHRKEALKQRPVLLAKQTLVKGIKDSPELALRYLERRSKDFKPKAELETTGIFKAKSITLNIISEGKTIKTIEADEDKPQIEQEAETSS